MGGGQQSGGALGHPHGPGGCAYHQRCSPGQFWPVPGGDRRDRRQSWIQTAGTASETGFVRHGGFDRDA
eukprot:849692-Prorocentrum_lima.AAC.1